MPKPNIIFRADGSTHIGMGHLVRSRALAQMLLEKIEITLVVREAPSRFLRETETLGLRYRMVTCEDEWVDTLRSGEGVVLDGYHFDLPLQRAIRRKGAMLVCIDDLRTQPSVADLIINHVPGVTSADYQVESHTQLALGPCYVLLRPGFLTAAQTNRKIIALSTLLICFGGADRDNRTLMVLKWVLTYRRFENIIVVTGPAYTRGEELQSLLNEDVVHYHAVGEERMVSLIQQADVAIVPSSSVLFEIIACGTIPIICTIADNQQFFHDIMVNTYHVASVSDGRNGVDELLLRRCLERAEPDLNEAMQCLRREMARAKSNYQQVFHKLLTYE